MGIPRLLRKAMRKIYVIGHWVLTLLMAPFTSLAIEYFFGTNPHQVVGLLEVYPITLILSIVFSLPAFLICLTFFYFLSKKSVNAALSKFILILVSVLGIFFTQAIIKGSMSRDITFAYSATAIVVGLILRLKDGKANTEDNRVVT